MAHEPQDEYIYEFPCNMHDIAQLCVKMKKKRAAKDSVEASFCSLRSLIYWSRDSKHRFWGVSSKNKCTLKEMIHGFEQRPLGEEWSRPWKTCASFTTDPDPLRLQVLVQEGFSWDTSDSWPHTVLFDEKNRCFTRSGHLFPSGPLVQFPSIEKQRGKALRRNVELRLPHW